MTMKAGTSNGDTSFGLGFNGDHYKDRPETGEFTQRTSQQKAVRVSQKSSTDSRRQRSSLSEKSTSSRPTATSHFQSGESMPLDVQNSKVRVTAYSVVENKWVRHGCALTIIANFVLICIETDLRAGGQKPDLGLQLAMGACFIVYVAEFFFRILMEQERLLNDGWNCADLFVILSGLVEYILSLIDDTDMPDGLHIVRLMRLLRLLRLVREVRASAALHELHKIMLMFLSSFKTLFWSFIVCFLVMTIWATIAVELLDDRVRAIAKEQPEMWRDCERCGRAFASVMHANITFFQTIVAGDSWGLIAVPVIEAHPWSAVIFVGALMTLVYGVLNLIVAVIVDSFADLRARDINAMAWELERGEAQEKRVLRKIFAQIDKDRSGAVSLGEILHAAKRVREFRNYMRILHIDQADIYNLYASLKKNIHGDVDPAEFVEAMWKMREGRGPSMYHGFSAREVSPRWNQEGSHSSALPVPNASRQVSQSGEVVDGTGGTAALSLPVPNMSKAQPDKSQSAKGSEGSNFSEVELSRGDAEAVSSMAQELWQTHQAAIVNIVRSSLAEAATVAEGQALEMVLMQARSILWKEAVEITSRTPEAQRHLSPKASDCSESITPRMVGRPPTSYGSHQVLDWQGRGETSRRTSPDTCSDPSAPRTGGLSNSSGARNARSGGLSLAAGAAGPLPDAAATGANGAVPLPPSPKMSNGQLQSLRSSAGPGVSLDELVLGQSLPSSAGPGVSLDELVVRSPQQLFLSPDDDTAARGASSASLPPVFGAPNGGPVDIPSGAAGPGAKILQPEPFQSDTSNGSNATGGASLY